MSGAAGRAAVFLDRDGTVVDELGYLADPARLRLLPGAAEAIRRLNEVGLAVVLVTNQSGIARGLLDEADLARVHARLRELLAAEGAHLDGVYHCPHHPEHGPPDLRLACECRKPAPGLYLRAARELGLALARSHAVGDAARDLEAARRAGIPSRFLVLTGKGAAERASAGRDPAVAVEPDLAAAARRIAGDYTR